MRPVQFLLTAFVVLAVALLIAQFFGGKNMVSKTAKWFISLCFIGAAYNMSIGISHGYSFMEEVPFLLLNFGVPSLAAIFIAKKMRPA